MALLICLVLIILCLSPTIIEYTSKCARWDCWLGIFNSRYQKTHNFSSLFPKSLDSFLEISVLLILSGLKESQWLFNHSFFIRNCRRFFPLLVNFHKHQVFPSLNCSNPSKFLLPMALKCQLFTKINNQLLIAVVCTVQVGLFPFYHQLLTCKIVITKDIPQAQTQRKCKKILPTKDLLINQADNRFSKTEVKASVDIGK